MARFRFVLFVLGFVFVASAQAQQPASDAWLYPTTDYALINGKIYTVKEDQPWPEAIAVERSDIVSVGVAEAIMAHTIDAAYQVRAET